MTRNLLVFSIAVLFGASANATPLKVELEDAADHHVSAQGSFAKGLQHSWEYTFGSKRSARNITGITAHGLIAAHRLTGLQEHQRSAIKAAKSLIRAYDQGWKRRRPYTQDIEFLASAGFIIDAARWFNVTRGRYTPAAYVDFVMQGRRRNKKVIGWDIASAIRAAVAVGQLQYAKGLLSELVRRRGEWDKAGKGQNLSRGLMLWAISTLKRRVGLTPDQLRMAQGMRRALLAAQQSNGAWLEARRGKYCTQTTAYAILGLSDWNKAAAAKGRAWLIQAALTDQRFVAGGKIWATTYKRSGHYENNFVTEIQSEAMMALATGK
jgi:hypothetical protein